MRALLAISVLFTSLCAIFPQWATAQPSQGIVFVTNQGQWHPAVRYKASIPGGKLYMEANGWTYDFHDAEAMAHSHHGHNTPEKQHSAGTQSAKPGPKKHAVKVRFLGSPPPAPTNATQEVHQKYAYYLGNDPSRWKSGVPGYKQLHQAQVYEGIALQVMAQQSQLKYELHVAPGASAKEIQIEYQGATQMRLENGHLVVSTSVNQWSELPPFAYQVIDGKKVKVPCRYRLRGNVLSYAFPRGYNKRHTLIIDPILIFSTYSGSFDDNWGFTAAFTNQGEGLTAGIVDGGSYPLSPGAHQTTFGGGTWDIALMKLNANGTQLQYATLLGGSSNETPHSINVMPNGDVLMLGATGSGNFPISTGAVQQTWAGGIGVDHLGSSGLNYFTGTDLFVARIPTDIHSTYRATFIGGTNNDGIMDLTNALVRNYGDQHRGDILFDLAGDIYIATVTSSSSLSFPGAGTVPQSFYGGGASDGMVLKLDGTLENIIWGTYLGGSNDDAAYAMRFGQDSSLLITGGTQSFNFPIPATGAKPVLSGGVEGWITRLQTSSGALEGGTFVGTALYDQCYLIDTDDTGDVYVFGQTGGPYPVTPGHYVNSNGRQFLHKFSADLQTSVWSTRIGTDVTKFNLVPTAFLVNRCGNIYISGWGGNTNANSILISSNYVEGDLFGMPTTADAVQRDTDGSDFYLMVLDADAQNLLYGTFFGGDGLNEHVDGGTSRFSEDGVVYQAVCAGCGSGSDDFPTTDGVWSNLNNSDNCNNAFFKFDITELNADFTTYLPDGSTPGIQEGCAPFTVMFANETQGGVEFTWRFNDGTVVRTIEPDTVFHTYTQPGTFEVQLVAEDINSCKISDTVYYTIEVFPNNVQALGDTLICPGSPVTLQATGADIYRWAPEQGLPDPTAATITVNPNVTTTYYLEGLTVQGCFSIDSVTVEVHPEVVAAFIPIPECERGSTHMEYQNVSENAETYLWDLGDGTITTEEHPVHDYADFGTYHVTLQASANGCTSFDEFTVVLVPFEITVGDDHQFCEGEGRFLFAEGATAYEWSPVRGLDNPTSPTPYASPDTTTHYVVTAYTGGICIVEDTVVVEVVPEPMANFEVQQGAVCGGIAPTEFRNTSLNGVDYFWNFGDDSTSTEENPVHTYAKPGTYTVTLTITSWECTSTIQQNVTPNALLTPPNVFTPNGDGFNPTFEIGATMPIGLSVFNRWGKQVYASGNYQDDWDGGGLKPGSYYYLITYEGDKLCKGIIDVLR